MAGNIIFDQGDQLTVDVIAGTVSGDAVAWGNQPGVALTDRAADGTATVKFNGVAEVTLTGAVQEDAVYIRPGTGALTLTDSASDIFFGVALNDSDADDLLRVRIGGIEPGSGS
jgi:predicted RecA/RadA family phage recombinase